MRCSELRTLNGYLVRNFEELAIANFPPRNGAAFEYEGLFEIPTATGWRRQYQLDFHLPDHDFDAVGATRGLGPPDALARLVSPAYHRATSKLSLRESRYAMRQQNSLDFSTVHLPIRAVLLAIAVGVVLAATTSLLESVLSEPQTAEAAQSQEPQEPEKTRDIVSCRSVPTSVYVPPRYILTPMGWIRTGGYYVTGVRTICEVIVQTVRSSATAEGARQAGSAVNQGVRDAANAVNSALSPQGAPPERPEVTTYPPPVSTAPQPTPTPTTAHEREMAEIQEDIQRIREETQRIQEETARLKAYNEQRYGNKD